MPSSITQITQIAEGSKATPGLFNRWIQTSNDNFASLGSGTNFSQLSNTTFGGFVHAQIGISIGSYPPSEQTTAGLHIGVNSNQSDYIYFYDTANQRSSYVLGSRALGTGDGLGLFDTSGDTAIVNFSKQSVRFFQKVIAPLFDTGAETFNVRAFGALGDGVADDTGAVQLAIDAAVVDGGGTVFFPEGTWLLSSYLSIWGNNISLEGVQGKSTLTWASFSTFTRSYGFSGFPSGAAMCGIVADVDNATIRNLRLTGPRAANTYVAADTMISCVGSNSTNRRQRFTVKNCEISRSGSFGIFAQFASGVIVNEENYVHDCGYIGVDVMSCDNFQVVGNSVGTIRPGTSGNMYGIVVDHDAASNYSTLANPGTKQHANPFAERGIVAYNEVNNINWEGIDCHGGYEIEIVDNRIYNTKYGIACASGSNSAASYAGYGNIIARNVIDARNPDGTASGRENQGYGINVNGGSNGSRHDYVRVVNNIIVNKGIVNDAASAAIQAAFCANSQIIGNTIKKWGGVGVFFTSSENMVITENQLLELSVATDGVAIGFYTSDALPTVLVLCKNSMISNGGTAGRIGFSGAALTSRPFISDNNFKAATSSRLALPSLGFINGNDVQPIIFLSTASTIPTLGDCTAPHVVIQYSVSSNFTITNIVGAYENQQVTIINTAATNLGFDRSVAALGGSAVFTGNQFDQITLRSLAGSWIEIGRSLNG